MNTSKIEKVVPIKGKIVQKTFILEMACATSSHTITLSDSGVVYSFGFNYYKQLGLGVCENVLIPKEIPNLPKIMKISCGEHFTMCVDVEGYIWSFGYNGYNVLGTDNAEVTLPQKIENIPPVQSIACGFFHTLITTNDSNLWSFGYNEYGQLFLENTINHSKPKKTSFSNVVKISAGKFHSFLQNNNGEIYGCGSNEFGQLGLDPDIFKNQIQPCITFNQIPKIIEFCCGEYHTLVLDKKGKVFSAGSNLHGQLGLNINNQSLFYQIENIPPIKSISCTRQSSFLLDFDGFVWSFGRNVKEILGHKISIFQQFFYTNNKITDAFVPQKNNYLSNIKCISYGCTAEHLLVKDTKNNIFVMGNNGLGQLGLGNTLDVETPQQLNTDYSEIWGDEEFANMNRVKSARK